MAHRAIEPRQPGTYRIHALSAAATTEPMRHTRWCQPRQPQNLCDTRIVSRANHGTYATRALSATLATYFPSRYSNKFMNTVVCLDATHSPTHL
eukprot:1138786-Pelagomonas_calceolata.AAC.2